jgi:diadenosine tetraphosphate (Ap4A) HIT family hydrolase
MGCIFCDVVAGRAPASIVWQDDTCIAFMDLFPLHAGHVLVVPRVHAALLNELPEATRDHLFRIGCRVIAAQKKLGLHADGANLLVNDGKPANQHVPHVHVHLVPRDGGDLGKVGWRFATRFLNPFGMDERRRELDALAARLAAVM